MLLAPAAAICQDALYQGPQSVPRLPCGLTAHIISFLPNCSRLKIPRDLGAPRQRVDSVKAWPPASKGARVGVITLQSGQGST